MKLDRAIQLLNHARLKYFLENGKYFSTLYLNMFDNLSGNDIHRNSNKICCFAMDHISLRKMQGKGLYLLALSNFTIIMEIGLMSWVLF